MVFTKNWRYIILNSPTSHITPSMIQAGLDSYPVPSKWITLSNDQSIPWSVYDDGYVGKFPWPKQEYTGVFFFYDWNNPPTYKDGSGAVVAPGAGSIGGYNKFSIAIDPNSLYYSDMHNTGHSIFHEIVNGYGFPNTQYYADAVFGNARPSSKSQFCSSAMNDWRWKNNTEIYNFCNTPTSPNYVYPSYNVEHATLSWCMEKMFPQYCLPTDYNPFNALPPTPTPVIPTVPKVTVQFKTIVNYTTNGISPNIKINASSGGTSVSGVSNQSGLVSLSIPCGVPVAVSSVTPTGKTTNFSPMTFACNSNTGVTLPTGA